MPFDEKKINKLKLNLKKKKKYSSTSRKIEKPPGNWRLYPFFKSSVFPSFNMAGGELITKNSLTQKK